jgi:bifunctional DNA-binding transcriptional regulator/antitoxin component of YhaV-PrlF toxin-antitoxin module
MPRLKLHFDGWLSLPAHFRQQLGLDAGAEIEAELVAGTIVLRPNKGSAKAIQEGAAPDAAAAMPAPSVLAAQVREPEQPVATPEAPPAPTKRRGRPPKAKA